MTAALLWVALAALLALGLLAMPAMGASRDGGRVHATGLEIEVGYRPAVPASIAVAGFLGGGLLGTAAVVGSGVLSFLYAVLALLCGLALLGAVGTLRRRPRVRLTAQGLDYRGWGLDASVAWADVEGTAINSGYAWRPLAEVLVTPGAPSLRHRVDPVALPEPPGTRSSIRMLVPGLEDPRRLLAFVEGMAALPPADRPARLGSDGRAFLRGGAASTR